MAFSASVLAADAVRLTSLLIGVSVSVQAVELLSVRAAFREDGVFAWSVLRRDFASAPRVVRGLLDGLLAGPRFVALLGVQLALALAQLGAPGPWLTGALLLTALLVGVRFRGTYNGGSDAMTLVVLLGLLVIQTSALLGHGELGTRVGLGYIAAQLVLSYLLAGLAKLRSASWRRGEALSLLVRVRRYDVPPRLSRLLARRALSGLLGWSVITFECGFPLALVVGLQAARWLVLAAVCFHLGVASTLGLNRFFWAWLAAYPALLFWSGQL